MVTLSLALLTDGVSFFSPATCRHYELFLLNHCQDLFENVIRYEKLLELLHVIRDTNSLPLTGNCTPAHDGWLWTTSVPSRGANRLGSLKSWLPSLERIHRNRWPVGDAVTVLLCNTVLHLRSRFPAIPLCCCCPGGSVFLVLGRAYISRFVFASHNTGC